MKLSQSEVLEVASAEAFDPPTLEKAQTATVSDDRKDTPDSPR